jgi:hypothetical protein
MFVLFNKDKKFVGYSPDDIPEGSGLLKKEIPKEQSDIRLWVWSGSYYDGKMVPIDIGYPIEEIELEKQLFSYIKEKYPLHIQINNIIKQLRFIIRENDLLQDEEFMDMADSILNAVDKHDKRVNYYKNYGNFVSKEESEKQFNDNFT